MPANDCPKKTNAFPYLLLSIVLCLLLQGCISATQLVTNSAVEIKKYDTVYLIRPKDDPRNVLPKVEEGFRQMGFAVSVYADVEKVPGSQGTGFIITDKGDILTCAHVLGDETQATVWLAKTRFLADVLGKNKDLDVAILKMKGDPAGGLAPVSFRQDKPCRMGEDAYTIGFPLSQILGDSARLSKGLVSATAGMKDDPTQVQISAEVQPGNSGGPVFDGQGLVFGVVSQTLNPERVYRQSGGALPQNVNFAVKSDNVLEFIQTSQPEIYAKLRRNQPSSIEKVGDSVVKVRSGNVSEDPDRRGKLVAFVSYVAIWDIWYRFRYFVISVFDFDSQEKLLVAGQGRDNMVSSEDLVIRDTLEQIQRALGIKQAPQPSAQGREMGSPGG